MTTRITRIIDPYVFFLQVSFKGNDLGAKQWKDPFALSRFSKLLVHRIIVVIAATQNLNPLICSKFNSLLNCLKSREIGWQMNV